MKILIFSLLISLNVFADFQTYIKQASDDKNNMNVRWQSLVKAAHYAERQQLQEIANYSKDKKWYMRNAALVAINSKDKVLAAGLAKELIQDEALVVRSVAVDILSNSWSDDIKKILITEVNKPYNFNKSSSLWIRKQIIEKLAEKNSADDKIFFEKMSGDSDTEIAAISKKVLGTIK